MACLTKHIGVVGLWARNILHSTTAAFIDLPSGSKSVQGRKCECQQYQHLCCQGTLLGDKRWYCATTWLGGQLLNTRHQLLGTELQQFEQVLDSQHV